MGMQKIAQELAKREAGKKDVSIAQIKEVLRCLGDMIADDKQVMDDLYTYALKRARRK
jgi:hypothetical protein